ncbi:MULTISPECIES: ABC transporter permease [Streptomyces]|uniref:ABC transporter permease n=1 Tax=Streptomyces parvulus TaxID=146923 RepID=A0A191USR8_9ACTN|nr:MULTISPECIES: ABC transporter permease [Streptomyces]ANJ05759.1 ABC transporter permease [Streptomyces parvulus]MCQ4195556.1 ABC transporter permease [Streptomyces parvulus]MZD52940.1 ABC transporter permease subunit [Streptomyces sp. SID5606]WML78573.1 ABC transporter permease [Streptomyces sp. VNUA74]GGS02361.1 ABC transporter permease [Streptomyces parvulus]
MSTTTFDGRALPAAQAPPPGPAPLRAPRRRRLGPGKPVRYGWAIGPVLLLALWAAGSGLGVFDVRSLPAPWTIASTARDLVDNGKLPSHLATSAQRALLGLLFGVAAGLLLALVSGLSRLGEAVIDGPVQIKRSIPSLALIPLLILWFGIGETMKVITIALGVFVPVYIHTHNGLRAIDSRYAELAETVRLGRLGFVRHVVLPGALPGFLLGMRFAVTGAWLALVVVEQVNATSGIGYMMELARTYGQTDVIIVGLVVYGLLGLASDALVRLVERRALSWRRTLAG